MAGQKLHHLPGLMLNGVKEAMHLSWLNDLMLLAIAILIFGFGVLVGYTIGHSHPADPEQTLELMKRVVNLEELESREKLNKVRMMRTGRKTFRNDSGPNARMMRMRVRRKPKPRR